MVGRRFALSWPGVTAAIIVGVAALAYSQEPPVTGTWVGIVNLGPGPQFAILDIPLSAGEEGTLQFPFVNQKLALTELHQTGAQLALKAQAAVGDGPLLLSLSGTLRGAVWTGNQDDAGAQRPFSLARLAKVELPRITGAFRTETGALISISPLPDQSAGPISGSIAQYVDTRTGRWGTLFAISPSRFISGPALARPFPVEIEMNALVDSKGIISAATWGPPTRRSIRLKRVESHSEEEVSFRNGSVTLAGTLSRPMRRGVFPAVVLTHGSGPQLRQRGIIEHLFLEAGFAVLTYDKRGVGKSSGAFEEASFDDLADDAVAGARMLQIRSDINSKRIGFWGLSQGGWIAPLAASKFSDTAFVVAVSGGGLSPEHQELFDTEDVLRNASFSDAEIADALSFQRARNAYLKTQTDWDTYIAARRAARGRKWYAYGNTDAFGPVTANDAYWDRQRKFYFYDPLPTLKNLPCAALFVFGALDSPSAVRANVSNLRQLGQAASSNKLDVRVVPNAGHNLFVGESDPDKALLEMSLRYAPGYPRQLVQWASRARC